MEEASGDAGRHLPDAGGCEVSRPDVSRSAAAGQHAGPRKPHAVATGLQGLLRGIRADPAYNVRSGRGHVPSSTSSASASCGLNSEAFSTFKRQRLFELASQGKDLPKNAALKEWKELPEEERERIKREVRERRKAEDAAALEEARGAETESAAGSLLQKWREQASRAATPAETRARLVGSANTSVSAKRKRKGEEKAEVPRPLFPQKQALNCTDRADRRREMAGSVRTRTQGSKASVTIAASHGVSLMEVSARLSAPTLSCDWARRDDGWNSDSDVEQPSLTVDMPADREARKLWDEQVRRKISSAQVRRLVQSSELPIEGVN